MMGTPLYMPPEAIANPEQVDARSDLYSLGGVGYFLLTGTTVFTGVNLPEIFGKHTSVEPESPSQRLGRSVDPDLEALILRCLAKSPDDRPGSAEEVAEVLSQCASAGGWTTVKARTWWSERKLKTPADRSRFTETRVGTMGDEGQCLSTIAP